MKKLRLSDTLKINGQEMYFSEITKENDYVAALFEPVTQKKLYNVYYQVRYYHGTTAIVVYQTNANINTFKRCDIDVKFDYDALKMIWSYS